MNDRKPLIIHIGPGHTGTTSLQESFFAAHPEINFFGKPFPNTAIENLVLSIHYDDSICFDNDGASTVARDEILSALDPNRCNVISSEGFASVAPTVFGAQMADRGIIAQRLSDLFGKDCKIVITCRSQVSALQSQHANLTHAFLKKRLLPPSLDSLLLDGHPNSQSFYFSHYDYATLADTYERIFGEGNVLIMPLEMLVADPGAYAERLCGFMGVEDSTLAAKLLLEKRNSRISRRSFAFEGFCTRVGLPENILAWQPLRKSGLGSMIRRWTLQGAPKKIGISERGRRKIHEVYRDGNKALVSKTGLDLKGWGYPLE